jgi:hypothetical protein
LQEVTAFVKVNEDVQFPKSFEVFVQLHPSGFQPHSHGGVVCVWDADKFNTSFTEVGYGGDDICRPESNVLNSSAVIEIDISENTALVIENRVL